MQHFKFCQAIENVIFNKHTGDLLFFGKMLFVVIICQSLEDLKNANITMFDSLTFL